MELERRSGGPDSRRGRRRRSLVRGFALAGLLAAAVAGRAADAPPPPTEEAVLSRLTANDVEGLRRLGRGALPVMARLYERGDVARRTLVAGGFYGLGWESPEARRVLEADLGTTDRNLRIGVQSVEVRDAAGDRDFPELVGSFPLRRSGWLAVHFALLVANTSEPFNIALAGPQRFALRRDGIAFWLQARDGFLFHVSDSIPKRLFPLRPFTWYQVDAEIDLDSGRYDLRIAPEGAGEESALVDLHEQPNAANQPGSGVEVFSFIGDPEDVSNAVYYVDDLVIGTGRSIRLPPFVAPGRRHLFAETLSGARRLEEGRLSCFAIQETGDLGLRAEDVVRLRAQGALEPLLAALAGTTPSVRESASSPLERALLRWKEGCEALERGEAAVARRRFDAAAESAPGAPLFAASKILAEIARGRTKEAAELLAGVRLGERDPRRAHLEALLLARSGEWGEASAKVEEGATPVGGEAAPARRPLAGARYHLALWQERYAEAGAVAAAELAKAESPGERVLWGERGGDAALLARDLDVAQRLYEAALGEAEDRAPLLCRLADVRFLRGDLAGERALRERVYGALRPPAPAVRP